jgi:leader peptidase (prepilin peptidase) / N-methyltransferase
LTAAELTIMVVICGLFGVVIGSFLNVVVYRVPAGVSIVTPASACPKCGRHIRGFDNVPLLSWLVLRGRCRDCGEPISPRYPAVELGTGLFFAVVAWQALSGLVVTGPSTIAVATPAFVAFLYLAAISVVLALIDLDVRKLPNVIVLPSYVVAAVLLLLESILSGDYGALLRAGIGMAALFLFYFVLAFAIPGGMGFGDVKLAGLLGIYLGWLGWGNLIVGAFAAFLFGGLFSVGLLIFRKAGRKSKIPFGPWMLLGAWAGILFGTNISAGYLAIFGLS